jgi:4,5-dihydroxyphthalate decarboxylase
MTRLPLSMALIANERVQPIIDGRVTAEGIDLIQTFGLSGGEVFWRQLHGHDFDVAEMSVSDMLMLASRGDRTWVMLPVFNTRRFFHTNILIRAKAGIENPAGLNGKRMGVQEYVQTANVWARGILKDHHGLEPDSLHWFQERPRAVSHTTLFGIDPPAPKFEYVGADTSLGDMMLRGEVDAVMTYAGKATKLNRSTADLRKAPGIRSLFGKRSADEGLRYFRATGIFPVNHAPVIRRSIVERHPWVMRNLFSMFERSKALAMAEMRAQAEPHTLLGFVPAEVQAELSRDLFPYGIAANRQMLDTLFRYSLEQRLSARAVTPEEVFADVGVGD